MIPNASSGASSGLNPNGITAFGNEALFRGTDDSGKQELWVADGSVTGTHELNNVAGESAYGVVPVDITVFGTKALFDGIDGNLKNEFWVTDGTATGTHELNNVAGENATYGLEPYGITVLGNEALFSGVDANFKDELWVTDGTVTGTHELNNVAGENATYGLSPIDITVLGDNVLFDGTDNSGKNELWVTDGTVPGTYELNVNVGFYGLYPNDITVFGNEALFRGTDDSGKNELWVTDGTATGTHELNNVAGENATYGLEPYGITVLGNEALFLGFDANGIYGKWELWATDGTGLGTHELNGITGENTSSGLYPNDITAFGNEALFNGTDTSGNQELWITNGTAAGTHELTSTGLNPTNITVLGNEALFSGVDANGNRELWVTDGTVAGTHQLNSTAFLTFNDDFNNFQTYSAITPLGWDVVGGPQWANHHQVNWDPGITNVINSGTLPYNNELQWYVNPNYLPSLPNPFSVSNGDLNITAAVANPPIANYFNAFNYSSGIITSYHSFQQTYGYFEMRAQLPSGQGLLPAFWLLPADGTSAELDVMEVLGSAPTTLYTTVHSYSTGPLVSTGAATSVADTSAGFHTYAVDWEPTTITWYFDGKQVFQTATPADMNKPMYMLADVAVGGGWPGSPNSMTFTVPATMSIDYIRAYEVSLASGQVTLGGIAADGYLAGSTVFADANGNGVHDTNEAAALTDASGHFTLSGLPGTLILTGGTDTSTGLAFKGTLRAPEGYSAITPLTTLVSLMTGAGAVSAAEHKLLDGLGLNAGIALSTLDPVAATHSGDTAGAAAFVAGAKVLDTAIMIATAIGGIGGNSATAQQDAFVALAAAIQNLYQGQTLHFSDNATIGALFTSVAHSQGIDVSQFVASVAATIAASNAALNQTLLANHSGDALLSGVSAVELVAQGNHPPTALNDIAGIKVGEATTGHVLANDSDFDGDALVVIGVSGGSLGHAVAGTYGTLVLNTNGSYTYTADAHSKLPANGLPQDIFTYTESDGHGGIAQATLNVSIIQNGQNYIAGTSGQTLNGGNGKNVLDGTLGNQHLIGGNAADVVIGGPNDTLTGGNGPDTFVFLPNFGKNTITDFDVNNDTIQFDHTLFANTAAVLAHAADDGHGNTVITDPHNAANILTLGHVSPASLNAHDFLIV